MPALGFPVSSLGLPRIKKFRLEQCSLKLYEYFPGDVSLPLTQHGSTYTGTYRDLQGPTRY